VPAAGLFQVVNLVKSHFYLNFFPPPKQNKTKPKIKTKIIKNSKENQIQKGSENLDQRALRPQPLAPAVKCKIFALKFAPIIKCKTFACQDNIFSPGWPPSRQLGEV
jgi:hypothetical protein